MSIIYKSFAIFLLAASVTYAAGKEKTEPPKDPKQAEKENEAKEVNEKIVHIPTFKIPVVQNRKLKTYYLLEFSIEATSHDSALAILRMRPKIVDRVLFDLYSLFNVVWAPDYQIDLAAIKTRITRICKEACGNEHFAGIFIQRFNHPFTGNN